MYRLQKAEIAYFWHHFGGCDYSAHMTQLRTIMGFNIIPGTKERPALPSVSFNQNSTHILERTPLHHQRGAEIPIRASGPFIILSCDLPLSFVIR